MPAGEEDVEAVVAHGVRVKRGCACGGMYVECPV